MILWRRWKREIFKRWLLLHRFTRSIAIYEARLTSSIWILRELRKTAKILKSSIICFFIILCRKLTEIAIKLIIRWWKRWLLLWRLRVITKIIEVKAIEPIWLRLLIYWCIFLLFQRNKWQNKTMIRETGILLKMHELNIYFILAVFTYIFVRFRECKV